MNYLKLGTVYILFICFVLTATGCWHKSETPKSEVNPTSVDVENVQIHRIKLINQFNGRISAIETVQVRPRVDGYIEKVAFKEGQEVHKGDLLFIIDQRPYKANYQVAIAKLDRAKAALSLAANQDSRSQLLLESNATSREEAELRRSTLTQAKADLANAEAELLIAKLNLEFTEVRSPINGRASRAMLTVGNLVSSDQSLLTTIVSQDPVYVYFDQDEVAFLKNHSIEKNVVSPKSKVKIGLANEPGFPHEGNLDFWDNEVNSNSGTIRLRAKLDNSKRLFTPGLYARVQLADSIETEAILVDDKAILTDQDRKYVYVLSKDNKAVRRNVSIGQKFQNLRIINEGIEPGEKVIVSGHQRIYYSGIPVQVNKVDSSTMVNS